jgi:hypothetical protein
MAEKSRVPWLAIVLTGLLAFVISMVVIAAIMAGYAFTLAMQAQGAPDPHSIAAFGNRVIPFLGTRRAFVTSTLCGSESCAPGKISAALAWRAGGSCSSSAYINVYAPSWFARRFLGDCATQR